MTLNTQRKSADHKSDETTAAGLPKTIRLVVTSPQGPAPGSAWVQISYQLVRYNYGGFVRSGTAEIIVPEPGFYLLEAGWSSNTVTGDSFGAWARNGVAPDAALGWTSASTTVNGVRLQYSVTQELKAGDRMGAVRWNTVAGEVFLADGANYFGITKLGGQY